MPRGALMRCRCVQQAMGTNASLPTSAPELEACGHKAAMWARSEQEGIDRHAIVLAMSRPPEQNASTTAAPLHPEFTMLCWNAYLIPKWFVNEDNATCQRQAGRAIGIGSAAEALKADVVAMQEVWGSSMPLLERPLRDQYSVIPWCRSWGSTTLDTAAQYLSARGGLWMAHRNETAVFVDSRWRTFSVSNTRSKKGIVAARFRLYLDGMATAGEARRAARQELAFKAAQTLRDDTEAAAAANPVTRILSSITGGVAGSSGSNPTAPVGFQLEEALIPEAECVRNLIVVNVHLDPTNENGAIDKQMAEIAEFIIKDIAGDAEFCPSSKDVGVILVGDFNVAPGSPSLRILLTALQLRDLYAERQNGVEPISQNAAERAFQQGPGAASLPDGSADTTYDSKTNGLAMWTTSTRIDLQFAIDGLYDDRQVKFQRIECVRADILRQPRGQELSDHWPVLLGLRFASPAVSTAPTVASPATPLQPKSRPTSGSKASRGPNTPTPEKALGFGSPSSAVLTGARAQPWSKSNMTSPPEPWEVDTSAL